MQTWEQFSESGLIYPHTTARSPSTYTLSVLPSAKIWCGSRSQQLIEVPSSSSAHPLHTPRSLHTCWACTAAAWFGMAEWCNLGSKRDPWFHSRADGFARSQIQFPVKQKGTLLWAWKRTSWDQSYCSTGSIFQLDYLACPFNQSWAKRCQPEERKAKLAINRHVAWLFWKPMLCTGSATK